MRPKIDAWSSMKYNGKSIIKTCAAGCSIHHLLGEKPDRFRSDRRTIPCVADELNPGLYRGLVRLQRRLEDYKIRKSFRSK